jgi:CHASE3 domain sensor protein
MGIKILLLLFALILVGMSILFYILINELESTQKEVKDLFLRDREVREAILTLN